jgi:hypothetical protein
MSQFDDFKTIITDEECLISALCRCLNAYGQQIQRDWIECHKNPVNLYGYKGDKREQKANIIIRRNHVGNASNDIGFIKNADGTYSAIISEYDTGRFNARWRGDLQTHYNFEKSKKEFMLDKTKTVTEETNKNGESCLRVRFKIDTTPPSYIKSRS